MLTNQWKLRAGLAALLALASLALLAPSGASAQCSGGGVTPAEVDVCTPTPKARLLTSGILVPPASAPPRVKAVIAAANRIRTKPYVWGGGHARWWDKGYDCSGSVSYALHGGEFIESPLPSGPMERWGLAGEGRWITVYANAEHVYMEIAGLRFDTRGDLPGVSGPRWHEELVDPPAFVPRHPAGL